MNKVASFIAVLMIANLGIAHAEEPMQLSASSTTAQKSEQANSEEPIILTEAQMDTATAGANPIIVFVAARAIVWGIDKITGRDNNAY